MASKHKLEMHFKSKKAYEDWLRYIYEHHLEKPNHQVKVYINGRHYKPKTEYTGKKRIKHKKKHTKRKEEFKVRLIPRL